jgi:hypothetical protein
MPAEPSSDRDLGLPRRLDDHHQLGYVLVAMAAFIAGLVLSHLSAERHEGASRIQWPAPVVPHPRTLPP